MTAASRQLFFSADSDEFGYECHVVNIGPELDFHEWTRQNQLTGIAASPMAVPHDDGVENLLKYAFGMPGEGPDHRRLEPGSNSGLPRHITEHTSAGRKLTVEFVRRLDSGLTYEAKVSSSLAPDSFVPMSGVEVASPINDQWEKVRVSQIIDASRAFARVEVTMD